MEPLKTCALAGSSRMIARASVVFPEPDSPRIPKNWFSSIRQLNSLNAMSDFVLPAYAIVRFRISRRLITHPAGCARSSASYFWAVRCPLDRIDKHPAGRHVWIPGVIHDVVPAIPSGNDAIMTGSDDLARNGPQQPCTALIPFVGVWAHHVIG